MSHINLVDPRICSPVHRIILLDKKPGFVYGKLIDNVHEFTVILRHDEERVLSIAPDALRVPWTTCPAALPRINALVGASLTESSGAATDKSLHCTHLFDLTRLAMAHAARGTVHLRYDLIVAAGKTSGMITGVAQRDGAEVLSWNILENKVVSTGLFHGHLTTGRARWPDGLSAQDMEAALLLRRTLLVFRGRGLTVGVKRASDMPFMAGVCHSYQPEQMAEAIRPWNFFDYPPERIPALLQGRKLTLACVDADSYSRRE